MVAVVIVVVVGNDDGDDDDGDFAGECSESEVGEDRMVFQMSG